MKCVNRLHTHTHLGEELSLRIVLRWKREGAKHTARLVQVIWFSPTLAVTSLRKHSKVWRASRFSSGNSNTAALTACRRCSLGTSETDRDVSLVYSEHNVWGLYAVVQIPYMVQWWYNGTLELNGCHILHFKQRIQWKKKIMVNHVWKLMTYIYLVLFYCIICFI